MAENIVARYNFEDRAQQAALVRSIETGTPHYFKADGLTGTFVVYTVDTTDES